MLNMKFKINHTFFFVAFFLFTLIPNLKGQDFIDKSLLSYTDTLISFYEDYKFVDENIIDYIATPHILKTCNGNIYLLNATISHSPKGLILLSDNSIKILHIKDDLSEDIKTVVDFLEDCPKNDYIDLLSQIHYIYTNNNRKSIIEKQKAKFLKWSENEIKENVLKIDSLTNEINLTQDKRYLYLKRDSLLFRNQELLLRQFEY